MRVSKWEINYSFFCRPSEKIVKKLCSIGIQVDLIVTVNLSCLDQKYDKKNICPGQ